METEKKRIRVPSQQQSGMPARPIQETNAGYHPSFPFLMLQKRTDDQNSQCTLPLSKGFLCIKRVLQGHYYQERYTAFLCRLVFAPTQFPYTSN